MYTHTLSRIAAFILAWTTHTHTHTPLVHWRLGAASAHAAQQHLQQKVQTKVPPVTQPEDLRTTALLTHVTVAEP